MDLITKHVMEDQFKECSVLMRSLVRFNKLNRELAKSQGASEALTYKSWLREYCTIKIFLGRQTGQTVAVFDNFPFAHLVYIAPNKNSLKDAQRLAEKYGGHGDYKAWQKGLFYTIDERWEEKVECYRGGLFTQIIGP